MKSPETDLITAWFVPRVTPYGGAPESIKEDWVGVPLPIRYDRSPEMPVPSIGHDLNSIFDITIFEDSVAVRFADAVKSLRLFGRIESSEWWNIVLGEDSPDLLFAVEPTDQIYPHSAMRLLLPGIETFDQVD